MIQPGLKGVTAVLSAISDINGTEGRLQYRKTPVQDLIGKYNFDH